MPTVADIKYLEPTTLRNWLRQGCSATGSKFLVVDVRDFDYVGGHIKNGRNLPANTLTKELPKLAEDVLDKDYKDVVFHCALSQQRGPTAAMSFLRYLNKTETEIKGLTVWILRGGFTKWQELYGEDDSATEGYDKRIWEFQ
ncbi:unnamed protein product [Kuraishia capsulata CBS 1993]|uniref:Rhodanese domain-containing protein n=1 Tax=Kuraishia capsulata CBS 1993 TaxID=1382522 RepID=W6MI24_9ASCO|nr:uncharacterized protein KUCA_T00002005001 [Kuraishia capsulata CBS 1993]CDK26034.1 unnamed protein product [Kuraishia capsulata CBS 1993]